MNLLIIGGTGKTGRELIKQGLDKGHCITAIVRNPNKLQINHPNLHIVKGNVLIPHTLEHAFKGQDAVLSALGHKRFFIKTTILSRGTKNIITAMDKHGVNRLLCITSLGINESRYGLGLYYTFFVIPFIIYFYFRDKEKQEKLIRKSGLDWTLIRPGQLTMGKLRTTYKHGEDLGSYIFTKMVSRADVAHFILQELETKQYINQCPAITN